MLFHTLSNHEYSKMDDDIHASGFSHGMCGKRHFWSQSSLGCFKVFSPYSVHPQLRVPKYLRPNLLCLGVASPTLKGFATVGRRSAVWGSIVIQRSLHAQMCYHLMSEEESFPPVSFPGLQPPAWWSVGTSILLSVTRGLCVWLSAVWGLSS